MTYLSVRKSKIIQLDRLVFYKVVFIIINMTRKILNLAYVAVSALKLNYWEKSGFYLRYRIEIEFSALQEAKAADSCV